MSFSVTQSEKGARATDVKVKAALGKQEGAGAGGPLFFGEVRSFNQLKGRSPPPSAPREREERREERVGELRLGEALLASAEALASSRVQRPRACLERIASSSGPSSAFNSAQPAPNQVAYAEGWFDSEVCRRSGCVRAGCRGFQRPESLIGLLRCGRYLQLARFLDCGCPEPQSTNFKVG